MAPSTPDKGRPRKRTWIAAAGALVLLGAVGAVAASTLSGGSSPNAARTTTSTGTQTTGTSARVTGPAVSNIASIEDTTAFRATLELAGAKLGPGHLIVRDADIRDGKATFLLRQKGMATRTAGGTFGPVRLRVRNARGLVRVDVRTTAGNFDSALVRRVDGHTVVVTLKKHRQPARGSTTVATSRTTTPPPSKPATTTTTTKTTTTKPIVESG